MAGNKTEEWLKKRFQSLEIRPYQLEAWDALENARKSGEKRALLHLATGLGKTSVAAIDTLKFREEHGVDTRFLFVSHMNDISRQAMQTYSWLNPLLDVARFRTDNSNWKRSDGVFATFQSLHSVLEALPKDYFSYIVWDEAHHIEAETFKAVRDHFHPQFELALTATPDRRDEKNIREYFGEPVFTKRLAEGIAEGWLADVDYQIVFDDAVKEAMGNNFSPKNLTDLNQLFKVKMRNDVIAKNIMEEKAKKGLTEAKTIVFCLNKNHASVMADLLGGKPYHSSVPKSEREETLRDFKSGKLTTICTRDMFNEGVDIPDTDLIVFLRSTSSDTIFQQQLGRGLRKTTTKTKVTVLDFVANLRRIVSVRELGQEIDDLTRDRLGRFATPGTGVVSDSESQFGIRVQNERAADKHASFEFDRMAVDLLRSYDEFNAPPAPQGYYTVPKAAEKIGVSPELLEKMIISREWQPRIYKLPPPVRNKAYRMLSPQQVRSLKDDLFENIQQADHRIISLAKLGRQLKTSIETLEGVCKTIGVPMAIYRFQGRRPGRGIERTHVSAIESHLKVTVADGYYSISEMAKMLGMSPASVRRRAERLGILYEKKYLDGRVRWIVSEEQIKMVKEVKVRKTIPVEEIIKEYQNTKSIQRTADTLGVSWNAVKKRLVKANVL